MEGESKRTHKLIVSLNYTDEKKIKSHCNMSSCCGLAVELLSPAGRSRFYFVSPAGGEEPKRGDFGET